MKSNLRVLVVIGTRPEAVKMAPVIKKMEQTAGMQVQVCITAQHRQMLDQVLELFAVHPDFDLDLMRENQSLAGISAAILTHLDPLLRDQRPDWMLVQGDTTTVMAASLLAYYHRIHLGHVEAGLRTGDKWQPFPEEVNRKVAGVIADLHFAPTDWARQNLLREGVSDEQIIVTGNPVIDALQMVNQMQKTQAVKILLESLGQSEEHPPRLVLVTAHRRENFGKPLENICNSLLHIAERYGPALRIVYPVHFNPHVQEPVQRILGNVPNITLCQPLEYLSMVHLMKQSTLILTDSGGIQEEAPVFGVPVLVLRQVTERPEGVNAGVTRLVGTDANCIFNETCRLLDDPRAHAQMAQAVNPYGDGNAAARIIAAILAYSEKDHS